MALERSGAFAARALWVKFKGLTGIPRAADKDFFCERIVRAMMQKDLHPETQFAGLERPKEGFGSQALSRFSIAATVQALGYTYRHLPMMHVAHAENNDDRWTEKLEAFFDLGAGEIAVHDSSLETIDFATFAENRAYWRKPYLVYTRDFYSYTRAFPLAYTSYLEKRSYPLCPSISRTQLGDALKIAVHVRRGDVSKHLTRHRFLSNDNIVSTLSRLSGILDRMALPYEISIYTNGTAEECQDLVVGNSKLVLGMGAIETFGKLIASDVLVTANSSFSFLAGLVQRAVVLYEPQIHRPLPNWIPIDADRKFSEQNFVSRIEAQQRTKIINPD